MFKITDSRLVRSVHSWAILAKTYKSKAEAYNSKAETYNSKAEIYNSKLKPTIVS